MCRPITAWTSAGVMGRAGVVVFMDVSFRSGRYEALLLDGGEHHDGAGLANAFRAIQVMEQQVLERLDVVDANLEQQRELAGDVVALLHLVELHQPLDERGLEARV